MPFDSKGFPNFEKYVKYDTKLDIQEFRSKGSTGQMRLATKDLAEAIKRGEVSSSGFNSEQLKAIEKGEAKIKDYTWHHHQDTGRMQLVPEKLHHDTGHIGWEAMSKGR
ncbi:TPA: HNH endonuclease [Neisseria cinerea]